MRVTFTPVGRAAAAKPNETILDVARRVGAPIGNSCGAVGICARCRVRVVDGELTPPTAIELRTAARLGFAADERLACQAAVRADCTVTTSYWGATNMQSP